MKTKRLISVVCLFSLVGFSGQVGAFDEGDLKKLLLTKQCWECDLSNANLIGANLIGADLSNSILTSANLIGADLSNSILAGANLTGADLTMSNLTGADLTGANLTGADLTMSNLTEIQKEAIRLGEETRKGQGKTEREKIALNPEMTVVSETVIVKTIDGREIELRSDGTYQFVRVNNVVSDEKLTQSLDIGKTNGIIEYDHFLKVIRQHKFFVRGKFDDRFLDSFDDLSGDAYIATLGKTGSNEYPLFKVECSGVPCTIEGHLDIVDPGGGFEFVFFVERHIISVVDTSINVKDLLEKIIGKEVAITNYVVWLGDIDRFLLTDTPEQKWGREKIPVTTTELDKSTRINLIKNCYKKCKRLRVEGRLAVSAYGKVQIVADKVLVVE